jgi:hypothetical protein
MNNDPQVFYLCYNLKIFIENLVISIIIVTNSKYFWISSTTTFSGF